MSPPVPRAEIWIAAACLLAILAICAVAAVVLREPAPPPATYELVE